MIDVDRARPRSREGIGSAARFDAVSWGCWNVQPEVRSPLSGAGKVAIDCSWISHAGSRVVCRLVRSVGVAAVGGTDTGDSYWA